MKLDSRLNAYRSDLADHRLKGKVDAETFVEAEMATIAVPQASLRAISDVSASITTQALLGDHVKVFERKDGWAWVQMEKDSYVGYLSLDTLNSEVSEPTHRVCVPATFIYPQANMKTQPAIRIFLNSLLEITDITDNWAAIKGGGYVYQSHIKPVDEFASDPVAVAEQFVNAPYLWGGCTRDGLDCSALVQQAYHASGLECPRDSDMVEATIGEKGSNSLQRGDLVFWDGHVGVMVDEYQLLHANGYHMAVAIEDFAKAEERIGREYGSSSRFKRTDSSFHTSGIIES